VTGGAGGVTGGASGAGGSAGSAGGDASSNGGSGGVGGIPVGCGAPAAKDWILCEDFENGLANNWTQSSANFVLPWAAGYVGKGIKAVVPTPGFSAIRKELVTSPITTGTLYVRMYIQVSTSAVSAKLVNFVRLWETPSPNGDDRISLYAGHLVTSARPDGVTTAGINSAPSANLVTADSWQCVSMAVKLHELSGIVSGSFRNETASTSTTDTLPPGGIQNIEVGISWADPAAEVLIDEIAVDENPIGCP
jgi:hypothetical protein